MSVRYDMDAIKVKYVPFGMWGWFIVCFSLSCIPVYTLAATVGLLSTEYSTYVGEYRTAVGVRDLLLDLGAEKVVLIDYNVVIENVADDLDVKAIEKYVNRFLEENNIDRIFIPGNYYNISSEPLPMLPNRQLVTAAIVNIMKEKQELRLLAVCGGLQGVLHAQGVKIRRIQDMLGSEEMARSHVASTLDPRLVGASLLRAEAVPGTKLASIVEKVAASGQDLEFYLPDAHSEAVDITSEENAKLLEVLGYKISALSDDGIIEALEDKNGNMLLQMHPEYLLMDREQKVGKNAMLDFSINVALGIFQDFLS